MEEFKAYKWKHQIAETDEEKKELRKSKRRTKLIKDIALLVALILMTCWWLFTIMIERKKAETRENTITTENIVITGSNEITENNEMVENNEIEEVVEVLE